MFDISRYFYIALAYGLIENLIHGAIATRSDSAHGCNVFTGLKVSDHFVFVSNCADWCGTDVYVCRGGRVVGNTAIAIPYFHTGKNKQAANNDKS